MVRDLDMEHATWLDKEQLKEVKAARNLTFSINNPTGFNSTPEVQLNKDLFNVSTSKIYSQKIAKQ